MAMAVAMSKAERAALNALKNGATFAEAMDASQADAGAAGTTGRERRLHPSTKQLRAEHGAAPCATAV